MRGTRTSTAQAPAQRSRERIVALTVGEGAARAADESAGGFGGPLAVPGAGSVADLGAGDLGAGDDGAGVQGSATVARSGVGRAPAWLPRPDGGGDPSTRAGTGAGRRRPVVQDRDGATGSGVFGSREPGTGQCDTGQCDTAESDAAGVGELDYRHASGSVAAAVADRVPERWRGARLAVGKRGLLLLAAVGLLAAVAAGVGVARDHPPDVGVPEVDTAVSPLGSSDGAADGSSDSAADGSSDGAAGSASGGGESRDGPGSDGSAAGSEGTAGSDGSGSADSQPGGGSDGAHEAETIVVSVQGLVETNGLFHLDRGARVAAALDAAGGPLDGADLLSLNLAQKLHDGDQVLVGVAPTDGGPPRLGSATVSAGGGAGTGGAGTASAGPSAETAPVDLNTAAQSDLESLPGVGPVTARAILQWRSQNGRFASVGQLTEVKGIGPATLADLRDSVTV